MFLGLRFAFGSFEVSGVSNFLMQAGDPVTAMCPWDNSEESPVLAVGIQNACYFDIRNFFSPFVLFIQETFTRAFLKLGIYIYIHLCYLLARSRMD